MEEHKKEDAKTISGLETILEDHDKAGGMDLDIEQETLDSSMGKKVQKQLVSDKQLIPDVRCSERLQDQLVKKHQNAILEDSKKKNLEGTNLSSQNSFDVLSNNEIMSMARRMGVAKDPSEFERVDFMKDLEVARHVIEVSKKAEIVDPNEGVSIDDVVVEDSYDVLEGVDEVSESEAFILVESRKKRRQKIKLKNSALGS
jgi:hypothetical protein